MAVFNSCIGEDTYSRDINDRLHFSVDSLKIDTIFTEQSTHTYTFQVYNPSSKALRIRQVSLKGAKTSPFRVNVDGTFLRDGKGEAFELAAHDSLRVFVEIYPSKNQQSTPQLLTEELIFILETGVVQSLPITGFTQDVISLKGYRIRTDETFSVKFPYHVFDSLVVEKGATLTLQAGTHLYFHSGAQLIIHGQLFAKGTREQNIVFRGDRLGEMFSNQAYDRIPGQWSGLRFSAESFDNVLSYCDIHSAEWGILCFPSHIQKSKLRLENSILHNFSHDGLKATMCKLEIGNSQLSNAGGNCINLVGGDCLFTHCTIAQFYPFAGVRGAALRYTNEENSIPYALQRLRLENCLLTGYNEDDILAEKSQRYGELAFNYGFYSCLLNTPKITTDNGVVGCIFENDIPVEQRREKHFLKAFDLKKLGFSFLLNPKSFVVGKADATITSSTYPLDRDGRLRLLDGQSDIGCYESFIES